VTTGFAVWREVCKLQDRLVSRDDKEQIMTQTMSTAKKTVFRLVVLGVALSWVATDAAWADKTRAGSSRSSSSSSKVSGSSQSSPSSSGRSAVSRSSAPSARGDRSGVAYRGGPGSRGAVSTRTHERVPARGGHGGGGYYDHGYYYGGYYGIPYYWSPWWGGYWGWGLSIGSGYGGYGGYGYYAPVTYSTRPGYRMGALDLSVRPKNTEVYVDGQYVGLAKRYDGFPSHLWLERGVYEIAFYKPGFATETRTVKVMTDLILDLEVEMNPGEAIQPEMRLRSDDAEDREEQVGSRPRGPQGDLQGRLHVSVEPVNALIYLDGNVLGTGEELAGLRAGLILSAGPHTLEAVRRGFETVEREIVVEPGEELETSLTLKPLGGSASP
jgi:hypothetical protein